MHHITKQLSFLPLLLGLAQLSACGAGLEQSFTTPSSPAAGSAPNSIVGNNTPVDHIPPVDACTSQMPAPRGLRRLTEAEINNTVQDLFASAQAPQSTDLFNNDPETYGFRDIYSNLQVRDNGATNVENFAEACATFAGSNLAAISSCTVPTDACRTAFITGFGARAFRQPLSPSTVADYLALMQSMPDFASGVTATVSAMLQSPYFLYRTELGGTPSATFTLTPYEVASELSYLYTASMPDTALMQAAAQNALATPAQLAAQAARLLKTPRAHAAVQEFFMQWLQVTDLVNDSRTEGTTSLSAPVKLDMQTEARMMIDDVVFTKNGSFSDLLTANTTFINQNLSTFYGAPGGGAGATFAPVPVASLQRDLGVLGLGGVLAAASQSTYASPTLRGRMVRMRLLCNSLNPPPVGVPQLSSQAPNQTTRQRFTHHVTSATCASCHTLMDPLGYTMGNYDTVGRRRPGDLEMGQPVDTTGDVTQAADGSKTPLKNLADLTQFLAQSQEAEACMSRHWAMYAFGAVSFPQDGCTYDATASAAAAAKYNLQQTLIGLTQVPSFTQRVMDP
jgi:hypothetical protein